MSDFVYFSGVVVNLDLVKYILPYNGETNKKRKSVIQFTDDSRLLTNETVADLAKIFGVSSSD